MFFAFEGVSCAGKSTLIKNIAASLPKKDVLIVDSPYLDPFGLGKVLRNKIDRPEENFITNDFVELMLANHAMNFENIIAPAIFEGKIVLIDRWFLSTLVYQSGGCEINYLLHQKVKDFMRSLEIKQKISAYPMINILLEVNEYNMIARLADRSYQISRKDAYNVNNLDDIIAKYDRLALIYSDSTRKIDANQSDDIVLSDVIKIIDKFSNGIKI